MLYNPKFAKDFELDALEFLRKLKGLPGDPPLTKTLVLTTASTLWDAYNLGFDEGIQAVRGVYENK